MPSTQASRRYILKPVFLQPLGILLIVAGVALIVWAMRNEQNLEAELAALPLPSLAEDQKVVVDDEQQSEPSISTGISTTTQNVSAATASSQIKAEFTALRIKETGKWVATDYLAGDIGVGEYVVQRGDTLWEISEAVYGNGNQWQRILASNPGQIGFLANGSQALIVPGQRLLLVL